ncbi:hypothetical protein L1987_69296 [Smallanthus sonchifolius]|uniref:Uncharacterized protein n=1 Tax=Smallanthus sonchifolius TaxID=185202 RepID=A0ACB9B681_9ASTR|nr:hypothetical protein L1987_69296 [Smallanthus sonchifolius]
MLKELTAEALLSCYGVPRFVMENGAKGREVIVSGKLGAQRAKSMKFKDGYMVSSGQPVKEYIYSTVRHVLLRQIKIMLDWDATGKLGPKTPFPDLLQCDSFYNLYWIVIMNPLYYCALSY